MTTLELSRILAASLPDYKDAEVWITTDGGTLVCRVVIVVPEAGDDPLSPRIELRSALVYRHAKPRPDEKMSPQDCAGSTNADGCG